MSLRAFGRRRAVACLAGLGIALGAGTTAANAPAGHYTLGTGAAAGTVFDNLTKLTWQQAVSSSDTKVTWANTGAVCSALQLDGGGWRVPKIAELASLVDYTQSSGPFIDSMFFPGTPSDLFWSATPLVGSTTTAWPVDFSKAAFNTMDVTTTGYVRCVR